MTYFFSVLRFVPDPARGEFVNLGAVVGDEETGDWDLRLISKHSRAKAIDDRGVLPAALGFAGEVEEWIFRSDDDVPRRLTLQVLEHLAGEMNNIVQVTPPAPIVADSSEDALDLIFEHKILDPASREHRFEKKFRAQKVTREAYRMHEVPKEAIKERGDVVSDQFRSRFDFAVHNGAVVQLVGCWSFQLPNQVELADQIKSWAWVVHEVRDRGGVLVTSGEGLEIPADLDVAAVCVPPKEGEDSPALGEARAAFEETGVEFLLADDADVVGARAARLLGTVG